MSMSKLQHYEVNEMQTEIQNVMKRVKKMLALAKSTSFAQEAETALRMAETLMAKYNLAMSEVELGDPSEQSNGGTPGEVGQEEHRNRHMRPWMRYLYQATCRLYGCEYVYRKCGNGRIGHIVIGKPHNIAIAVSVSNHLVKTVNRLCRQAKKEMVEQDEFVGSRFRTSFCTGASRELAERIRDLTAKRYERANRTETETTKHNDDAKKESRALAVVMVNELAEATKYCRKNIASHNTRARRSSVEANAYGMGREAGKSIGLDRQLH